MAEATPYAFVTQVSISSAPWYYDALQWALLGILLMLAALVIVARERARNGT